MTIQNSFNHENTLSKFVKLFFYFSDNISEIVDKLQSKLFRLILNPLLYFFSFGIFGISLANDNLTNNLLNKPMLANMVTISNNTSEPGITSSGTGVTDIFSHSFNFNYSGNVLYLPLKLAHKSNDIKIDQPNYATHELLAKFIIRLNLINATIQDISDEVLRQTDSHVILSYNRNLRTIGIHYQDNNKVGQSALNESLRWQNGLEPRIILDNDGVVRFPYGSYLPVITCAPLNLCDIELDKGERIQSVLIGDSIRWDGGDGKIPIVYSGSGQDMVPHLVLKPDQSGLDTSLMVTTNLHTYMIKLRSAGSNYVAKSGFYYPQGIVEQIGSYKQPDNIYSVSSLSKNSLVKLPAIYNNSSSSNLPKFSLIDLTHMNHNYSISGGDYVWKPKQVFDDGNHVYIQMPVGVNARDLPGICVSYKGAKDSDCALVNFRYLDNFYIVDKLFNKAKLVNGNIKSPEIITVTKIDTTHWWSKLFN